MESLDLMGPECGHGEKKLTVNYTLKSLQVVTAVVKLKDAYSLEGEL